MRPSYPIERAREMDRGQRREGKSRGAATRHAIVSVVRKKHSAERTGSTKGRSPALPLRDVYIRLITCDLRSVDQAWLSTRHTGETLKRLRQLDACIERQDHTLSPSAAGTAARSLQKLHPADVLPSQSPRSQRSLTIGVVRPSYGCGYGGTQKATDFLSRQLRQYFSEHDCDYPNRVESESASDKSSF